MSSPSAMSPPAPAPSRRVLRAYAYDPLLAELNDTVVSLSVPFEPVEPGPVGSLLKIVDYDPVRDRWYSPVDLDDAHVLAQDGLAPSEADPRFHQQMVYAVGSSVLEHFEAALGRRFRFTNGPMPVYPHAFEDQNAYYDPSRPGLYFGYFLADRRRPGRMMPGQMVFTCLSHDIVAHELTHAVVDRLRPKFTEPTGHDVPAFHEAFADLVAVFHHFALPDLVRRHLAQTRADLVSAEPLVELARQFGEASAMAGALRSGIDKPNPRALARTLECHDRGAILVGAVFAAFVESYQRRIADLIRIATGGTGQLPPGHLHPDLVARVADEAVAIAKQFLTICVRAIDYMPVVDVTFGDFLRAMVTADDFLFPTDGAGTRSVLIESFRRRGIYPEDVGSLAQGSLLWPEFPLQRHLSGIDKLIRWTAEDFDSSTRLTELKTDVADELIATRQAEKGPVAAGMHALFMAAPEEFGFHANTDYFEIEISRFHASFRASEDGQPRVDITVEALQRRPDLEALPELEGTGLTVSAGTTVVADALGRIRHVIPKPLPDASRPLKGEGGERFQRICEFVADRDAMDATHPWAARPDRITAAFSGARLHRGRVGISS